ncbi:MAG: TraR/DksA C4-type zinc finger protein [Candidatus Ratteibacteria bacterium]|nr:TraR/DksA C4-type zinc finger protein [Candidatus Ratteibacteria bacterium]
MKSKGMSKKDAKKYQQSLQEIRKKVIGEIEHLEKDNLKRTTREASGDLSGYRLHMADVASDAYAQEFAIGLVSSEQNLLREVEKALNKVNSRDYGLCENCGKRITVKRLKAIPYAHLCIDCKEKEELQGKR